MLEELRVRPTLRVLEELGVCLAYRSTAWLAMYCRLGGVAMQLEVSALLSPAILLLVHGPSLFTIALFVS